MALSQLNLLTSCLELACARVEAARLAYLDKTVAAQLRNEPRTEAQLVFIEATLLREERRRRRNPRCPWQHPTAIAGHRKRSNELEWMDERGQSLYSAFKSKRNLGRGSSYTESRHGDVKVLHSLTSKPAHQPF
jgi:hypothetical protein